MDGRFKKGIGEGRGGGQRALTPVRRDRDGARAVVGHGTLYGARRGGVCVCGKIRKKKR